MLEVIAVFVLTVVYLSGSMLVPLGIAWVIVSVITGTLLNIVLLMLLIAFVIFITFGVFMLILTEACLL